MTRRMKVLVSVLVVVLLLTMGGAATVLAQEEEEEVATGVEGVLPPFAAGGLLARIAEILDIPEEELIEAFQQARQEMMEESWEAVFYQMLDRAVAEGLITPEEAEEISEWWVQKPEALDPGLLRHAFSFQYRHGGQPLGQESRMRTWQGTNFPPGQNMRQEVFRGILEKALAEGRIAPEKADEVREWLESKLNVSDRLPPARLFNRAMRGRNMMAGPGRQDCPLVD